MAGPEIAIVNEPCSMVQSTKTWRLEVGAYDPQNIFESERFSFWLLNNLGNFFFRLDNQDQKTGLIQIKSDWSI